MDIQALLHSPPTLECCEHFCHRLSRRDAALAVAIYYIMLTWVLCVLFYVPVGDEETLNHIQNVVEKMYALDQPWSLFLCVSRSKLIETLHTWHMRPGGPLCANMVLKYELK